MTINDALPYLQWSFIIGICIMTVLIFVAIGIGAIRDAWSRK